MRLLMLRKPMAPRQPGERVMPGPDYRDFKCFLIQEGTGDNPSIESMYLFTLPGPYVYYLQKRGIVPVLDDADTRVEFPEEDIVKVLGIMKKTPFTHLKAPTSKIDEDTYSFEWTLPFLKKAIFKPDEDESTPENSKATS